MSKSAMDTWWRVNLLTVERLVYERWGGEPTETHEAIRSLEQVARRQNWKLTPASSGLDSCASYLVYEWQGRYGEPLGWILHTRNIVAVSPRKPERGFPPDFGMISTGVLHDALSADGSLVLPEADWLFAPLLEDERAAILQGGGWEANSLIYWKPTTRAELLFNCWD